MKTFTILILSFLCFGFSANASDSTIALTPSVYFDLVINNHPTTKQAALLLKEAKAKLLSAKGVFDPELSFNYDNKTLDGSQYYQYIQPQLKAPLWYGIELNAEITDVRGNNTANELTRGNAVAAGVSLPLLNGLVMNKKMAVLKQAKNNIQLSKELQQIEINNLLLDAMKAYWNWSLNYQLYNNTLQAKQVSLERLVFTKKMFEVGERPAIDTVEAYAQYKLLDYETQNNYYEWIKSNIELSLYLWDNNEQPVYIKENMIPVNISVNFILDSLELPKIAELEQLVLTHPKLNMIDIKLKNLEIERKLKFQSLLPTLNAKYNFINKSFNPFYNVGDNLLLNNYKIGIDFKMPLLFRSARGEFQEAKIQIASTQLERTITQNELTTKVKTYFNDILALKEKLKLYNETVVAYQNLLKGETTRFENGESSLFLINNRQNKVLESLLKLNELKAKYMEYNTAVYLLTGTNKNL